MNLNGIMSVVSLGLDLIKYFMDMKEEDLLKIKLPTETKTKLAILRAQKKAKDKYLKEKKDEK